MLKEGVKPFTLISSSSWTYGLCEELIDKVEEQADSKNIKIKIMKTVH